MSLNRVPVAVIQRKHYVAACADRHSLWVEIAGPRGGHSWNMSPGTARQLAAALFAAAARAEGEAAS